MERALAGLKGQRIKRVALVVVAALALLLVFRAGRRVLPPYLFGLAAAYVLVPVVNRLARGLSVLGRYLHVPALERVSRALAVAITYLLMLGLLASVIAVLIPMLTDQAVKLWNARMGIWERVNLWGEQLLAQYQLLPPTWQQQMDKVLADLNARAAQIIQQALEGTVFVITYTLSLVLGILVIPFWVFFVLKDYQELQRAVLDAIPGFLRADVLHIALIADRVFGAYLRGQLLLGLIIGSATTIGLSIMGVNYALVLGVIAGVFELIPNIGPLLGAIPAVVVALAQRPSLALAVLIFAIAIQQIENLFLTPRVVGNSVRLHPAVVMLVLIIGSEIGGVVGLFLAPLMAALFRDTFRYLYYRFQDEAQTPEQAFARVWEAERFSVEV